MNLRQFPIQSLVRRMGESISGNGEAAAAVAAPPESGLEPLTRRLAREKVTKLALAFLDANSETHLKDLPVESMTDERRAVIEGREVWNFGSDSFLGLDRDPRLLDAIRQTLPAWGSHNGASRAFSCPAMTDEAEARLARWLGVADTFIFPSVTLANIGLLPAITGRGDLLLVDRESHDSVHQAARLAAAGGATLCELPAATPEALRRAARGHRHRGLVLAIDGVYSMSGRTPPLAELDRAVRELGGMLYVDDAHGTGVVGRRGRGAACEALGGLENVLMVGSLSKAFSCLGAFVTCTPELKAILKIRSSTFIFGGPVPPPYVAAILAACEIIDSPEGDGLLAALHGRIERVQRGLDRLGVTYHTGSSAIVSLVVGDIEKTFNAGRWLFDRGYYVQSATYPAVPIYGGLLRIQVNANHPLEAIDGLLEAIGRMPR
jgi:glycine C-acetyltransferase